MSHASALIADDIEAYLEQHERKELLRFLTCGSVDDGKSTLIGRLLYDSKLLYEDQLAAIRKESSNRGPAGGEFDPALVTDGLKAEREQGITIDVAYRYFSTAKRKFIIADTPGHEQYTRNMATGASNCDLAVILVDARHGVVTQTRRHSFIVSLLGIKHVVVAINKMDLVNFDESIYREIQAAFSSFAAKLEIRDISFIPISALVGDNVVEPSESMPWYQGSTLMHHLENVHIASDRNLIDFRFPVQYVNRPDQDFRGYCGTIASGVARPGDQIMVLPSRKTSRIEAIHAFEGELDEAHAPMAVTLTLTDEIDISRGDVIAHPGNLPQVDQTIEAMVVWMGEEPMSIGGRYLVKHLARYTAGVISRVRYRIDVNTLHRQGAGELSLNEIGRCTLELSQPIGYDSYANNRASGAFIIIDRLSNGTVGAGMIIERPSEDSRSDHWDTAPPSEQLHPHPSGVSPAERRERLAQPAMTLLLTGLSGSGKSTIAYALERRLFDRGQLASVVDGGNMRLGLSRDLGFSGEERSEALRRGAEVARVINDSGLICVLSYVAPSEEARARAAETVGADRFKVVHLDAPLDVCRARDTAGIYRLADADEGIFPGVNSPYDPPSAPDLHLDTASLDVEACVNRLLALIDAQP